MKDTEYLVKDNTNKERVLNSIAEAKSHKVAKSDIEHIEPVIDSDVVIKMMDNMSIAELKMLKAACAVLINFKLNESMNKQLINKE